MADTSPSSPDKIPELPDFKRITEMSRSELAKKL